VLSDYHAADTRETNGLSRFGVADAFLGARPGKDYVLGFEQQILDVASLRTGFLESQRRSGCVTRERQWRGLEGLASSMSLCGRLYITISSVTRRDARRLGTARKPRSAAQQGLEKLRLGRPSGMREKSRSFVGTPWEVPIFVAARKDYCVSKAWLVIRYLMVPSRRLELVRCSTEHWSDGEAAMPRRGSGEGPEGAIGGLGDWGIRGFRGFDVESAQGGGQVRRWPSANNASCKPVSTSSSSIALLTTSL
jgi:hypothetical protein